jgi:crotonobetainyl-CoA:carnitine CoA-transferase CaiB-like acyl-CoA transferase
MTKALEGIRIVDFTHAAAGTTCTMMLAAMGAEVIKIEPPWGEITRVFPPLIHDYSPYFFFLNRNKKGITLDLKNEKAIKIVNQLVEKADIVVENFGPGAMDRLGLSYDSLKKINPKIIYASISGFGQYGPYTKRLSFDNIAQAASGFTSLTSKWEPGTPPPKTAPNEAPEAIADTIPGLFTVIAILAALNHRNVTNLGQYIDVAQADVMISVEPSITYYSLTGNTINKHLQSAIGGVYQTKDGYVTLAAPLRLQDRLVALLKNELGSDSVEPEDAIKWARGKTTDEIVKLLVDKKIPVAPINTVDKVITDEHFIQREMIIKIKHEKLGDVTTTGFPIKFSETPGDLNTPAPLLGEHTVEVLRNLLKYSDEEINELKKEGVI